MPGLYAQHIYILKNCKMPKKQGVFVHKQQENCPVDWAQNLNSTMAFEQANKIKSRCVVVRPTVETTNSTWQENTNLHICKLRPKNKTGLSVSRKAWKIIAQTGCLRPQLCRQFVVTLISHVEQKLYIRSLTSLSESCCFETASNFLK